MAPLRVLIGTPASGGMVSLHYMLSLLTVLDRVKTDYNRRPQVRPLDVGLYTLGNESLISRGRNYIASVALYQHFDRLFFIDADVGFTFEQFLAVATSEKPIIAGVCPLKVLPIHLNFEANFDDVDKYMGDDNARSVEFLKKIQNGFGGASEIPVRYVGTAFFNIDVHQVLRPMAEVAAPYRYPDTTTGALKTNWNFFDTSPINKMCMSEDYGFIAKARSMGIEPWVNADVIVTHTGAHTFRTGDLVKVFSKETA